MLAAVKPLKSSADYGDSADSVLKARPTITEAKPAATPSQASNSADSAQTVESLFRDHNQRVFRTAYRVTGSAADAEDVLQTVFLRVTRGQEAAAAAENTEAYSRVRPSMHHLICCAAERGQKRSRSMIWKVKRASRVSWPQRTRRCIMKIASCES